jgi:hypothetical protein
LKVTKESIESFIVEFESDEELRREFEANLNAGGLFLSSMGQPAELSTIQLNLRLNEGGSFAASATVVRLFEGAFAVSIDANPQRSADSVLPSQESSHNYRRGLANSEVDFDLCGCRRSDCEDDSMVIQPGDTLSSCQQPAHAHAPRVKAPGHAS